MHTVIQLLLFVVTALGYALAIWPLLTRFRTAQLFSAVLATVVLTTPLLISADQIGLRALACVLAIDQWFKMLDYSRCLAQVATGAETFRRYALFLLPFPVLLIQYPRQVRQPCPPLKIRKHLTTAVASGLIFTFGYLLLVSCSRDALFQSVFILDHAVKLVIFVVSIEALSSAICSIEHLVGYETQPLIDRIVASRNVADFWCRFNTRVHRWFLANVFNRVGGHRHPLLGVCLTFLLSGLFHELMFGIATSRVEGYQFAFFVLQIPGILLSRAIVRLANRTGYRGGILGKAFTALWLGSTSVLFFHGVDKVFPAYYAAEPLLR